MYKTVTVRELLAAIRKNGRTKAVGNFFELDDGSQTSHYSEEDTIEAGCALGQAYLNIVGKVEGVPHFYASDVKIRMLMEDIVYMNDKTSSTLEQIADTLERKYPSHLDDVITISNEVMYEDFNLIP